MVVGAVRDQEVGQTAKFVWKNDDKLLDDEIVDIDLGPNTALDKITNIEGGKKQPQGL